jgi:AcrR family transcriptional regulator
VPVQSDPGVADAAPLRKDAERNRQRILATAAEVFADRGLDVSMDDIAAEAGVGVGTVYRRFPSKQALVDALFEQKISAVVAAAERAAAAPDAFDGLLDFIWTAAGMHARDQGLHQVLATAEFGGQTMESVRVRLTPIMSELVRRAREQGRLRSDFAVSDLGPIMVMANAVALHTRPAGAEVWRRHLQMLLDGLRADGPQTPLQVPALTESQVAALCEPPPPHQPHIEAPARPADR